MASTLLIPAVNHLKILIMCGLNDRNLAPVTNDTTMKKIVKELERQFPGSKIYVAEIPYSNPLSSREKDTIEALNKVIRTLGSKEGIESIPRIHFFQIQSWKWQHSLDRKLCPYPLQPLHTAFKLNCSQGNVNSVPKIGETVINLSNYQLSETELNVLNKGLTFIPTKKNISHTPILEAGTRFGRRLKIGYHFRKSKLKLGPEKFIPKSNWEPSDKSIHSDVINTIKEIHNDLSKLKVPAHKENLSKSEATVLKKLKQNPEIVLKPADKGSATVILDRENCVAEGNRQLNNPNHYMRLDQPIFQTTSKKIDSILQDLHIHNFISAKQLLNLRPSPESRPRRMYMLPRSLDKWPFPNKMPPGRPIISDCSSKSYAVSEYIDHFLQDISRTHASYVRDSSDFISKLCNVKTKPDTLLITLDVESMYTNIDNERGLAAVKMHF